MLVPDGVGGGGEEMFEGCLGNTEANVNKQVHY